MYPGNIVLDATKVSAIQSYLQAGGRVYLEGNDALEFDQGGNLQLHELFGLGAGSDGGTNAIDGLNGQVGSITNGMLFTASTQVSNSFIDIYLPYTGKSAFIESSYGDVAVQNSGPFGQKTFCFSYALAYLTDGSFPNTKNQLMTRILNYLTGPATIPPDINVSQSSLTFNVDVGGTDSDIITISNLGQQNLVWNVIEEELPPLSGIKLELENGREIPVNIKPKYNWNQPVKGEDYVPYPPSALKPPMDKLFKPLHGYESTANQMLFGKDAFGTETFNDDFIQFDLGTPGVLNPIAAIVDLIWAGDFGDDLTFAYAANSTTNRFIKINKTTGVITDIGPCLLTQNPPAEIFSGMAVDPTTGIIYLSSTDITTSWLYTVNSSTGGLTLVGVLTNAPAMIAIAINNNGQMYGYDIVNDVMLSVNKSTGAGTVLGSLGFNANFAQGMDFDPITGTLYLSAFNSSTGQAELRTGNTTNGSTTLVGVLGSITPGSLVDVTWLGLPGEPFDCTWLSENPVSGGIAGGGNQVVDIFVDATGLTAGTYNCDLIISSNDPDEPSMIIPVTLNVEAATFSFSNSIENSWNMVSIPGLHPTDQNVNTWWAFRDMSAPVYKYPYVGVTTVTPGAGYWMKHTGARVYNTGDEWPLIQIVPHAQIPVVTGWNLVGGYELTVTTSGLTTNPPGQLDPAPVYGYQTGYVTNPPNIVPGDGYWVKVISNCNLIIPETLSKTIGKKPAVFAEDWGKIILTDASGKSYTLYAVKGNVDLDYYEMPPLPPSGMFDVRYESNRIAEDINSSIKGIEMRGVEYPVTVRVENMDIRLQDETGRGINVNIKDGENVVISDVTIMKLMVTGELIPAVYALEQNYPNPFNPSTMIEFSLPEDVSSVKLSIYNALGEKVAELVNSSLSAGKYSYQWNAQNVATGMYIYELRTDKFVSVKKMVLLK